MKTANVGWTWRTGVCVNCRQGSLRRSAGHFSNYRQAMPQPSPPLFWPFSRYYSGDTAHRQRWGTGSGASGGPRVRCSLTVAHGEKRSNGRKRIWTVDWVLNEWIEELCEAQPLSKGRWAVRPRGPSSTCPKRLNWINLFTSERTFWFYPF